MKREIRRLPVDEIVAVGVGDVLEGRGIFLRLKNLHVAARAYVIETGRIILSETSKVLTQNHKVERAYLSG